MVELAIGVAVGLLFGFSQGWPAAAGAGAGLILGLGIYVLSCAIWTYVPCWWPWCSKRDSTRKGPGRAYRRRKPCRVCKGRDYERLGARLFNRG